MSTFSFNNGRIEVEGKVLADNLEGQLSMYQTGSLKQWGGHFDSSDFSLIENREKKFLIIPGQINGMVVFTNFNGDTITFKGSGNPNAGSI
ncbi:hypothetical protein E5672_00015 [Alteromonas portus]|uniref:Uncharacterized protein n=1 Tax=Alteromonas portus TaxID=2565549 RepID=A0A4U0ZME1_9ALTE|nr:hypothetical protein [Alteromonas portus]TKB04519.1 hypothetical protein E5672_00015 [Alteromonas portus]